MSVNQKTLNKFVAPLDQFIKQVCEANKCPHYNPNPTPENLKGCNFATMAGVLCRQACISAATLVAFNEPVPVEAADPKEIVKEAAEAVKLMGNVEISPEVIDGVGELLGDPEKLAKLREQFKDILHVGDEQTPDEHSKAGTRNGKYPT